MSLLAEIAGGSSLLSENVGGRSWFAGKRGALGEMVGDGVG